MEGKRDIRMKYFEDKVRRQYRLLFEDKVALLLLWSFGEGVEDSEASMCTFSWSIGRRRSLV